MGLARAIGQRVMERVLEPCLTCHNSFRHVRLVAILPSCVMRCCWGDDAKHVLDVGAHNRYPRLTVTPRACTSSLPQAQQADEDHR